MTRGRTRTGFSLIELTVIVAVIAILIGILIPTAGAVRQRAYIDRCASNLSRIGAAIAVYAQENRGALPRTTYVPGAPLAFGTNPAAVDAFAPGGPVANDVTAAVFHLRKGQKLPAELFVCPYNDAAFAADPVADPARRSNFTDARANLGYSFLNVYPADADVARQQQARWNRPTMPVAADLNPGTTSAADDPAEPDAARDDVLSLTSTTQPADVQRAANSRNHAKDGQNVLYGDGHVEWQTTALCGVDGDNLYTTQTPGVVVGTPASADDAVLLPVATALPRP